MNVSSSTVGAFAELQSMVAAGAAVAASAAAGISRPRPNRRWLALFIRRVLSIRGEARSGLREGGAGRATVSLFEAAAKRKMLAVIRFHANS
jgi:hypothetical protein